MVDFRMYIFGAVLRFYLATSEYQCIIAERIEVSTPLNSWRRVTEGLYLMNHSIHPFTGDILHEQPLHLLIYKYLINIFGKYLYLVFIVCDLVTAHLLSIATKKYIYGLYNKQKKFSNPHIRSIRHVLVKKKHCHISPGFVAAAYLINPYIIFNCVGFTTTVFNNFFLAIFLVGLTYDSLVLSTIPLAICISQNLYPVLLISPLFIHFRNIQKNKGITAIVGLSICWFILTYLSACINNNWNFLNDTYGFTLAVPDLRPNIGLFWYFFIEMFEHFRVLFIYAFQINVLLLYYIPLTLRFRKDTMLLSMSLLSLISIFKSYPCLGDVGFVLSLLPCWQHLLNYIQQGFPVGCCFIVTTVLAPTVWYLWIYLGSANANFYFGVTLAFATAQIFLITDILFSYVKCEFTINYGRLRKVVGDNAQLMLE